MNRGLMFGVNKNALDLYDKFSTSNSVYTVDMLEEPDLVGTRGLTDWSRGRAHFGSVLPIRYQQNLEFLKMPVTDWAHYEFVAPGLEYAVLGAAHLADKLGIRGAGIESAEILSDKIRMREATAHLPWGSVRFAQVHDADEVAQFCALQAGVLKPANSQASVGVQLIRPDDDMDEAWASTFSASEGAQQVADRRLDRRYLVEEVLSGQEHSVEAICVNGRIVWCNLTKKSVTAGQYKVELAHSIMPLENWCWDAMQQLVDAIGFGWGILHAEWMVDHNGPKLIECAGRPPGDQILDAISIAHNFDPVRAWFDILAGRPPSLPSGLQEYAAVAFIVAREDGVVAEPAPTVEGTQTNVVRTHVTYQVGDIVRRPRSSWDRLGYVIARGVSPQEATALAQKAAAAAQPQLG